MNQNIKFLDCYAQSIDNTSKKYPCRFHAIRSRSGKCFTAHIHLQSGAHYSLLPINQITFSKSAKPLPLNLIQPYDCFSDNFEIVYYDYFSGRNCIHKYLGWAEYLFTADFSDNPFSDNPIEFKQLHFIKTTSGHLACAPNNYLLFQELTYTGIPNPSSILKLSHQSSYPSAENITSQINRKKLF